jgi:hypothetical protein
VLAGRSTLRSTTTTSWPSTAKNMDRLFYSIISVLLCLQDVQPCAASHPKDSDQPLTTLIAWQLHRCCIVCRTFNPAQHRIHKLAINS